MAKSSLDGESPTEYADRIIDEQERSRKMRRLPPKQLPGAIMFVPEEKVNHPSHYNQGNIEVIDFIEDQQLDFHEGNTIKYICRAKHKGNELEDLKKAAWYLQRKIEKLEGKKEDDGKLETTNSR